MKKYLTIYEKDKFYRLLHIEQSKKDRSIFIRHIYHLHSKSSYHTNHGKNKPPYEYHLRGCSGKVIQKSIQQRKKLITDYNSEFACYHFNELPKNQTITQLSKHDIVINIDGKNFTTYKICLFSEKRTDLLRKEWDNATVIEIPLLFDKIIAGCFNN